MAYPKFLSDFTVPATVLEYGIKGVKCVRASANSYSVNQLGFLVQDSHPNRLRFGRFLGQRNNNQTYTPGILIEKAATNLLTYSDYTGWTLTGALYNNYTTLSAGGNYTFSVYLQKTSGGYPVVSFSTSTTNEKEIENCTIASYGIYKRVSYTFNVSAGTTLHTQIDVTGSFSNPFWLAQLETGTFATSAIATYGAIATRDADEVYIDISLPYNSWFNPSNGTFFVTGEAYQLASRQLNLLYLRNVAGTGDLLNMGLNRSSNLAMTAEINSYADYGFFASCDNPGNYFGAAFSYVYGAQYASIDGRAPISPSTPQANTTFNFSTVDRIWIGSEGGTTNFFNGVISRFAYYDAPLGHIDLNNLTQ